MKDKYLSADDDSFDAISEEQLENSVTETFKLNWKNPPKVSNLKDDYTAALPTHSSHTTNVNGWLDVLAGTPKTKFAKNRSSVQPKLARKQAEWRYASLSEPFLSSDNIFDAQPVTWEDTKAADQNTLVLNHQFNNKINKVRFIDEYVRTGVDEGTIVVKVGWEYEEAEQMVEEPVMGLVPVQDPAQAQQMIAQGIPPFQEAQTGTKLVKKMVAVENHPTAEICEFENVIIDPTCKGDISKAKFVIHRYNVSMDVLRADKRYKNLDNVQFTGEDPSTYPDYNDKDAGNLFTFKDKTRKKVVMHEYWGYWDVNNDGSLTSILVCYIGDTIVRMEENPYPDKKLPFVVVQYLPVRKSIYGEPDSVLIEDNQAIIGAITRGMIDLMGRSANAQQGIRKDALDVVNKRKFDLGEDYQFNPNIMNPEQAVFMHRYPEIPQSAMMMIQYMNNEAESITGVKAYNTGIGGQGLGNTATGVRGALDAASKRELGILRRLADGIVQIGRKFISMNAEFLSDTEVVRITNDNFVPVKRDDLAGNIDLRLTISTAETDNEKAQELAFMLQTLGNSVPMDVTMMIMSDIAKLRKMPELAKKLKDYQPPAPDPMQLQMQQLQLQMLQAQVMNEQAKGQDRQVDAQLKLAKAGVAQAQARKMSSDADMLDLDFVNKSTGTDHKQTQDLAAQEHQQSMELAAQAHQQNIDEHAAKALLDFHKDKAMPKEDAK
jgi:hypothetical protein